MINEIGNRYGSLTVIREATKEECASLYQGSRHIYWYCKCDCGKFTVVNGSSLRRGNTVSCGCWRGGIGSDHKGTIKDISGQRFGYWTALEPTDRRHGGTVIWKCRCDCGTIREVSFNTLRNGTSKSCGCIGASFMESYLAKLLNEKDINYIREYTFDDLADKRPLRFDFALFLPNDMILIELDGEQHKIDFQPTSRYSREQLDLLHYHDEIKNRYCKEKGIKLYRLSYTKSEKQYQAS